MDETELFRLIEGYASIRIREEAAWDRADSETGPPTKAFRDDVEAKLAARKQDILDFLKVYNYECEIGGPNCDC